MLKRLCSMLLGVSLSVSAMPFVNIARAAENVTSTDVNYISETTNSEISVQSIGDITSPGVVLDLDKTMVRDSDNVSLLIRNGETVIYDENIENTDGITINNLITGVCYSVEAKFEKDNRITALEGTIELIDKSGDEEYSEFSNQIGCDYDFHRYEYYSQSSIEDELTQNSEDSGIQLFGAYDSMNFETETNDTYGNADLLYQGTAMYGALESAADADWYKIKFTSSGEFNFWIGDIPANKFYKAELYKKIGSASLSLAGTYSNTVTNKLSNFNITGEVSSDDISNTTWYYLKVYSGNSTSYNSAGSFYRVVTNCEPYSGDAYGNTIDTATTITIPKDLTTSIDYSNDIDYFKFVAPTSGSFTLKTTGALDTYGTLFNYAGQEISSSDDYGDDLNFNMTYSLNKNQTYYLKVRGYGSSTGSYTLSISVPDDYGNTFDTATTITVPNRWDARIDYSNDYDYFKFMAPTTGSYTLFSTGSIDTRAYLYNSSKGALTNNDDGGENTNFKITYTLTQGEIYYLYVKGYSSNVKGAYKLLIWQGGPDTDSYESNNTVETATSIATSGNVYAMINTASDVDYYKFTLPAGTERMPVTLTLRNVPMGVEYALNVYDANQNQIKDLKSKDDNSGVVNLSTNVTSFRKILDAGTYYIKISSINGYSATEYRLNTSASKLGFTLSLDEAACRKTNWSWAACAEMVGRWNYRIDSQYTDYSGRDQVDAVRYIKHSNNQNIAFGSVTNANATTTETALAHCYVGKSENNASAKYSASNTVLSKNEIHSSIFEKLRPITIAMTNKTNNSKRYFVINGVGYENGEISEIYLEDPYKTTISSGETAVSNTISRSVYYDELIDSSVGYEYDKNYYYSDTIICNN